MKLIFLILFIHKFVNSKYYLRRLKYLSFKPNQSGVSTKLLMTTVFIYLFKTNNHRLVPCTKLALKNGKIYTDIRNNLLKEICVKQETILYYKSNLVHHCN